MTSNSLPPRQRIWPIERFAGVAPDFERTDHGYFYRRRGYGPAIRVTASERDDFVAADLRSLLIHAAALAVFGVAAWLVLDRMLPTLDDNALATLFGIVLSLIAMALYLSMRWNADAPARALDGRRPEKPARDPDFADRPGYGAILALTLILLVMAAMGTKQPVSIYFAFGSASVMLGLFLALRKWRFDAGLTPAQRQRAADEAAREKAKDGGASGWKLLLLFVFVAVQIAVLFGAVFLTLSVTLSIAGSDFDHMSFGQFIIGFLAGLALGGLIVWPIERLCRHWTGASGIEALDFIPASW